MKYHPVSAAVLILLSAAASFLAWFALHSLAGAYYVDGLHIRSLGPDVEPGVMFVHQLAFWVCVIFAGLFCLCGVMLVSDLDIGRWWHTFPVASVPFGALLGFLSLSAQACSQYSDVTQCLG